MASGVGTPASCRRRTSGWALLLGMAALALLGGCRDGTVRLSFRPQAGRRYTYRIAVRATTVTTVADEEPRRTSIDTVFFATQTVLSRSRDGGRIEVRAHQERGPTQTFIVRLDRSAELAEVQTIEGLPARTLGNLGLSEIFPAAAAAPPDRSLAPGERWDIDTTVRLAQAPTARLRGKGRLVALGRIRGVDAARVTSSYRLPLRGSSTPNDNGLILDGTQRTTTDVAYSIDDGAVLSAEARTTGSFGVTFFPPAGTPGSPVAGTLSVTVSSTTERVDR